MSDRIERAVLGSVIIDETCYVAVSEHVDASCFEDPRHRTLWVALEEMKSNKEAIDLLSVTEKLELKKWIDSVGGHAYVAGLVDDIPDIENAGSYAKIMRDEAMRRRLVSTAEQVAREAVSGDVQEGIHKAQEALMRLSRESGPSGPVRLAAAVSEADQRTTVGLANPSAHRGVPTGLSRLDDLIGGLQQPDLVIVAARPGVGKTAMAMSWASHQVIRGKSVAFFSLEMSSLQLAQRLQSNLSHVSASLIRTGSLTRNERASLYLASRLMSSLPLWIDDTAAITIHQIHARCDKLRQMVGLDVIYVDYLQILGSKGSHESRNQEVATFSRGLKAIAKELRVPVVAMSQLSRRIEMRDDQTPVLSDLRESGSIEQDADIVMFLSGIKERNQCEVNIVKHRNGPLGSFKVGWKPQWTAFGDLAST